MEGEPNNVKVRTLCTSPDRLWMGDEVKEDEIVEACSTYGKSDKWIFIRKDCKEEREDLGDLDPDDIMIIKWILKKYILRLWTAFM